VPALSTAVTVRGAVLKYLQMVEERSVADSSSDPWMQLKADSTLQILQPLLEKVLSVPATSAPVERVFSQSGLIMRQTELGSERSYCASSFS